MAGPTEATIAYVYCNGCTGAEQSVDVTLEGTSCYTVIDGYEGSVYRNQTRVDLLVTIPSSVTCDIPVRIKMTTDYSLSSIGGGSSGTDIQYFEMTISSGTTSETLTNQLCFDFENAPEYSTEYTYFYEIVSQATIPSCDQAPGCNLEITSTSVTGTTLLGASDGAVTAFISGATGSSYTFRLNGGTPQSSPTFTGLAAGTYQIRVDEGGCNDSLFVTITSGAFNTDPFTVIQPSRFVASENPILLTLSTAVQDGVANVSITEFALTSSPTLPLNNFKVQFTLTSPQAYTVTFTAKDFPNKPNYFLSDELTNSAGQFIKSNSAAEIMNSFGQALEQDAVIGKSYYVNTTTGGTVTLVAKIASSRYDITSSNVTLFDENGDATTDYMSITQTQAGTDFYQGDVLDNYNIYVEVYGASETLEYGQSLSSVQFNRLTEVQLPYQQSNFHKFDFSEICKAFVYTPKPDYEFTGYTTLTTYMQPFYFKYGELYPLVANTNTAKKRLKTNTQPLWVANAALDYEVANDMRSYTGTTISTFLRNVPFLTNAPSQKSSSRRQRELLYFILPKNLNQGTLDVRGDITFWDGTELTGQTFITITTNAFNFGGVAVINVSFDILGLDMIETSYNKLIKQLDIAVYSSGGTRNVTNSKTYIYDLEERVNRVGISWLNKLGTFDSFDFSGLAEGAVERQAKDYTLARNINFDGSMPYGFKNNATYDVALTKKINVNTGWINAQVFDWLIELISSNEIYIYSNEYDNYCRVTGFKYSMSSNDTLYNMEMELTQTIQENNITV